MNWMTIEELLLIHEMVIEATGGLKSNVNLGSLESALLRPFTSFGGQDMFPTLCDKVGAFLKMILRRGKDHEACVSLLQR